VLAWRVYRLLWRVGVWMRRIQKECSMRLRQWFVAKLFLPLLLPLDGRIWEA
jgi:hypothetical protein